MATITDLLTAEAYGEMPDGGRPSELVRGKVVWMNPPQPRHGQICFRVARLLAAHVEAHDVGHILCNDSGIITERDPDTVRGADVAYYSYARVPKGPMPAGYLNVSPELVFEVLSPNDRWSDVHRKVGEYLAVGVVVVCVIDPAKEELHVFDQNQSPRTLTGTDELKFPQLLGEFCVMVRKMFES